MIVSKIRGRTAGLLPSSIKKLRATSKRNASYRPSNLALGVQSIPFSNGGPNPGVSQGPEAIRSTGFLELLKEIGTNVKDYGALDLSHCNEEVPEFNNEMCMILNSGSISDSVARILRDGRICLNLGGDHSIGIGTIHGATEVYEDLAVLYVDAHADLNTPLTTWSGNYHGMTLGLLVEELEPYVPKMDVFSWLTPRIPAKNLAYIGLRDVDDYEKTAIEMTGALAFSTKEVSTLGIDKVMDLALERICPGGKRPLHLSFDVDALDELEVKSTIMPRGLTLREGLTIVERVKESGNLVSMDLVEVDPLIGTAQDVKKTTLVAKQLLLNLFGYYRGGVGTKPFPQPINTDNLRLRNKSYIYS